MSRNVWQRVGCLAAAVLVALAVRGVAGEPPRETRGPSLERFAPKWNLGDGWVVETTSRPVQVRDDLAKADSKPVQWQFAVDRFEKSLDIDCIRLEVRCLDSASGEPRTSLWIDKQSRSIRRFETQMPVPGGFQTVARSFDFPSGQAAPVLGLLSTLPLELPAFTSAEAKGGQSFFYEMRSGPAEAKALGEVGFAYQVEQQVVSPANGQLKALLGEEFSKDLESRPVVEIRLSGHGYAVSQWWRPELPWAVYSDNGTTVSRLVKVLPRAQAAGTTREPKP